MNHASPRRTTPPRPAFWCLLAGLAGAGAAHARPAAAPGTSTGPSPTDRAPASAAHTDLGDDGGAWSRVIFGAKVISVGAPAWDGAPHRNGLGLLVEIPTALPHMEVELAAACLTGTSGVEVPLDMLFKYAHHLNPTTDLFVGAGPMVAWLPGHGVGGGLLGSLGGYQWLSPAWGVLVEVDYTVFGEGPVAGHALEVAAGVVWRPGSGVE